MEITETRKMKLPEGYTLMNVEEEDDPYERGKLGCFSLADDILLQNGFPRY
jgi:hypothetical protein